MSSPQNCNAEAFASHDSFAGRAVVDVVMPYFNASKYFIEQRDSILRQTLREVRLLILDNGSNPENSRFLMENTINFCNVTVLRVENNRGVVGGIEYLLKQCTAPYVALSDADDIWDPDKLEISLSVLRKGHFDLVYSDLRLIDAAGRVFSESHWENTNSKPYSGKSAIPLALKNPVAGCTILARAELIFKALPFPSGIPMHDRWLAVVAALGRGIGFVDRATISYRQHGSNDTGSLKFGFSTLHSRFSKGGGSIFEYLRRRRQGQRVLHEYISRLSNDPLERGLSRFLHFYSGLGLLGSIVFIVPFFLAILLGGRNLGFRNFLVAFVLGITAGIAGNLRGRHQVKRIHHASGK